MRLSPPPALTLGLGLVVWLLAVGLVAEGIHHVQRDSRRQLEQRFEIRADIAARFVATYAREIIKREQAQAAVQLAGARVTRSEFDGVVAGGGYQAAVLTDARGRLLQVAPRKPSLLGEPVGRRYEHLRSALEGRPAVSRVVPAAAGGAAIVAFATPFDTPQGRRVFSGAFDVKRSPLAAYLASVSPIQASAVELVDPDGASSRQARRPQARARSRERGQADATRASARRSTARRSGSPSDGRRHALAAAGRRARGEPLLPALGRRTLDPLGWPGDLRARLAAGRRALRAGC